MNFFDLHCDTAFELYKRNLPFNNKTLSVTPKQNFENWYQAFAIWIKDDAENPWELYKNILNDIKTKLIKKPQNLTPLFSVEGGSLIENRIERIDILKKDRIKMLTLTWNGENTIAGGVNSFKGLTDFGKEVIKKLNEKKIACDLSHANEKSFYKALELSDFPIATHSNCFKTCPHKRNLKTEQLKLLAEKGGIIGLTFYTLFLGENIFDKIYENICFLCDLSLQNHIAIGSDFDGAEMSKKLDNISKIPQLYSFLEEKGLEKTLLDGIFYKNAYNFIAKLD